MIRWSVFIVASLVLHMMIFIIPFQVSFSEAPESSPIAVDVELVLPARETARPVIPVRSPQKVSGSPVEEKPVEEALEAPQLNPVHSEEGTGDIPEVPGVSTRSEPRVVGVADIVKRIGPLYPLASRRRGEEGEVRLLVTLGSDGSLVEVTVYSSSGYRALDGSAVSAVRKWIFAPGSPAKLIVPVIFKLEQ